MITESKPYVHAPAPEEKSSCGCSSEAASPGPPPFFWRRRRLISLVSAVLITIGVIGAALSNPVAIEPVTQEIWRNVAFILNNIWKILPYLVLSVAASTWVSLSGFSNRIRTVFERREMIAVGGAAAVGATIPICSCTVVPLIAGLLAGGVPFGPIMAFWISAPLMSPEKFFLTAGVLGSQYAVARLMTAVLLGASAGYVVTWLARRGHLQNQLHGSALPSGCCSQNSSGTTPLQSVPLKRYASEAGKMTLFLGKWLTLAFLVEALIVHYLDPAWISAALGGDSPFAIPLATAIGIPLYTSGVAAIPIAKGLLANGMAPGAALAFLVAGPVTTIPAMMAVRALVKNRLFSVYLGAGIVGSLLAGYLFQAIFG